MTNVYAESNLNLCRENNRPSFSTDERGEQKDRGSGCINSEATFVSKTYLRRCCSRKVRRFAYWLTRRKFQTHATKRCKALSGKFRQIPRYELFTTHSFAQDSANFLFHRPTVRSSTQAQVRHYIFIKIADYYACQIRLVFQKLQNYNQVKRL